MPYLVEVASFRRHDLHDIKAVRIDRRVGHERDRNGRPCGLDRPGRDDRFRPRARAGGYIKNSTAAIARHGGVHAPSTATRTSVAAPWRSALSGRYSGE